MPASVTLPSSIMAATTGFSSKNKLVPKRAGRLASTRACKSGSEYSGVAEFNLYELLGVENFSDRTQIKEAYRGLQKRCHPDIAGPAGHDMAIVLNEAYALLSDPLSRMAYDKELAKFADLQGYTGKPLYSVWLGSESEQRAAFVDEVKCVGCLKCALHAEKTFAVESVYGRARVVAQWADPEDKIQEAISSCPVDCISFVARSDLPAFEYIMSKQPRGRVRIGVGNTVGARTSDIFKEVEKFQERYTKHRASSSASKESESQRVSRASAIQAIQMISNWLYWQSPSPEATPPATQNLARGGRRHVRSSVKKLKAAAEARKQAPLPATRLDGSGDYWVPSDIVSQEATAPDHSYKSAFDPALPHKPNLARNIDPATLERSSSPLRWGIPAGVAAVAAVVVRLQLGEHVAALDNHISGSWALAVINNPWSQALLAGMTWYLITVYLVELFYAIPRK